MVKKILAGLAAIGGIVGALCFLSKKVDSVLEEDYIEDEMSI